MKTRNTCCRNEPIPLKLDNPLAAMLIIAKHAKRINGKLLYCIYFEHFFFVSSSPDTALHSLLTARGEVKHNEDEQHKQQCSKQCRKAPN